jgi:2-keto-4-pentenoate hydratase
MSEMTRENAATPAIESPAVEVAPAPPEPAWSVDQLVESLVAARRGGEKIMAERVLSAVKSSEVAYQVQARVDAALWPDAHATVWKGGADSRDSLPTAAPIAPALVHETGASLPAASFPICIVEAEIAYRFGVDLPPRATPYSTDEVAEAIETMHVAIEIVTPRIVDFTTASSLAKLADHQINGAFILGSGIKAWRRIDLRKQKATLSINGKVHESVRGSHALGNPAVLLPWFVAHLGRLPTYDAAGHAGPPRGVLAGDVFTTGSWTKVVEAKAKQRVDVVFEDIGSAAVSFVP